MFSTKKKLILFAANETELDSMLGGRHSIPIQLNNKDLVLLRHNNKFHVVNRKCPHQGKELTYAKCEDGKIVCPWHHYAFDLKNGRGNGLYLDVYPIHFKEDGVFVEFEYFSWF